MSLENIKPVQIYYTHFNGGRPYKVQIENNKVNVYKSNRYDEAKRRTTYDPKHITTFNAKKVFIGKSPLNEMTEFSGGYGPGFDGNTILLELNKNEYVYIGVDIISFDTKSEIKEYISPVGNNYVPYPFAIDIENNYYLLESGIVILNNENINEVMKKSGNPENYIDDYFTGYDNKLFERLIEKKSFDVPY